MKKFEYFISYIYEREMRGTSIGTGVFVFDFNIDETPYDSKMLQGKIPDPHGDIVNAAPLFYHLRRVIEE